MGSNTAVDVVRPADPLANLTEARRLLELAHGVDEVKSIRDKAEALRLYARQAGYGLEMQNECAELKLRAERRAGELLADMPKNRGAATHTLSQRASALPDLGINHSQSHRWQRVASLPEEDFEAYVGDTKSAGRELTTRGALQLARAVVAQDPTLRPTLHVVPSGDGLPGLSGTFTTIVADPPWRYDNRGTRNAAAKHYPTMTVEDLCDLGVEAHAEGDSHLYLWTTTSFLRDAFDVLEAWGFTYKTNLAWVKPQMGMGNYFRVSHEHVLFGVRGSLPTARRDAMSWFQMPRVRHSSKPESFLDLVESCSPGSYLEMFNRRRRMGWTYWGNE